MMKRIVTSDGSITFRNDRYEDIYHSTIGAATEAMVKYVKPSQIGQRLSQPCIRILDVCFGLGYNTAAALDHLQELNYQGRIEIICLENDEHILKEIARLNAPFISFPLMQKLAVVKEVTLGPIHLTLIVDDARESVKHLQNGFDAVYFDPFSPKKQPELWQTGFLSEIRMIMKRGAVLTTYSCARMVRDNLRAVGFSVSDGPRFGTRSPATVAVNP
jgi:tRNA U34 5-methylaminomethyl-2-thiouridine-forming methyltransferase MnmC